MWIIGLSGTGKSTLGEKVVELARGQGKPVVFIDGDTIRQVFGNDLGHSIADRKKNAGRICRLGQFLEQQGVTVVCAVLSLFHESQDWNRANLKDYFEVYIDTPFERLVERDSKGLYKKALDGEIKDVAGVDLPFAPPPKPNLVIHNDGSREALLAYAHQLVSKL